MLDVSTLDAVQVLIPFILIGFAAQLVDGALGMAFGVISTTLFVTLGVPPAVASAGVHTVECFTTGVSGISHIVHRNVDWKLLLRLALPGVIGAILGAYALTQIDAGTVKPFVLAYLAAIGLYLVYRGVRYPPHHKPPRIVEPLGLAGGFLDAAGGGGWGPVVTGNLLVQGAEPRRTIGTVNSAEFLVTLSASITFIAALGLQTFSMATLGLLIGGVAAAPIAAVVARRTRPKLLLLMVGVIMTLTSLFGIYQALMT
ncbi:MAG TPA: sulfite exporter TauE/SafE family protein [Sphingomicrobium sp.]|nr:sulfite exporter TauE/SafE family protein [Sphingomicrobium sp.]